jgi:UDP-N-acetylglucosamine:LPS N-acetylglucosamine transferase
VVTGAPVRPDIVAAARPDGAARAQARQSLDLPPDRFVVGLVGGSLGAKTINEATLSLAALWRDRPDVAMYHVVGRRDLSWAVEAIPQPLAGGLVYRQVPYEKRMALFYQAADVVVGRAGANTVAELALMAVPSVLVPLPGAPGDHQTANATMLSRAGGCVIVPDDQCTGARLADELDRLRTPPERLEQMRAGAASLGRADAVAAVAAVAETHARHRSGYSGRPRAAHQGPDR